MATIANIAVSLTARTSAFNKGLQGAVARAKNFGKTIGRIGVKAAGLVAGLGVLGAGFLTAKGFRDVDRLAKLEKITGISSDSLQVFKVAAERGGSTLDVFAKAARSVARFGFDALIGKSKDAQRVFKVLGISSMDLQRGMKDNEFLMGLVADKLNGMEEGALKTAVATKLLGGRNTELLASFAGGSAEFAKIRKELTDFGLIIDGDKSKVEAVNDTFDDLLRILGGVAQQFALAIAPDLLVFLQDLKERLRVFLAGGGLQKFAQDAVASMQSLSDLVVSIADGIRFIQDSATTVGELFDLSKGELDASAQASRFFGPNNKLALESKDPQLVDVILQLVGLREDVRAGGGLA